jgi:tetratricopeptide (TPR) repeat protein
LTHALALQPGNADAWYYKGISFVNLKKIPEAYACFEEAVGINPGHTVALAGKKELTMIMERMKKK